MTGAASSVIGVSNFNIDGVYHDANKWAQSKFDGRPNELAKFQAEKAAWNEVVGFKTESPTQMSTLLPYFVTGPPLYKEAFNSSCRAISDIINSTQYGFPQVQLPIIDVRDLARLHVLMITHPSFSKHGRYLVSQESKWFGQIIELLKERRLEYGQTKRITTRTLGPATMWFFGLVFP
jgi:nucleoside-diphosphate-sugar epimerase